jgi:hypothetical protein
LFHPVATALSCHGGVRLIDMNAWEVDSQRLQRLVRPFWLRHFFSPLKSLIMPEGVLVRPKSYQSLAANVVC